MVTSQLSTFFIAISLFSVLLPQAATKSSPCGGSQYCNGQRVRFPFQLATSQSPGYTCVYPGFDLWCKNGNQTIITLPTSGDFAVIRIRYEDRTLSINDPDNCLLKRFLEHKTSLVENSPFSDNLYSSTNYTFLNCSSLNQDQPHLYCLSGDNYTVTVVPTYTLLPGLPPPNCTIISTALIPGSFEWYEWERGIELTWDKPDCSTCEFNGQICGLKDQNSLELKCFGRSPYAKRSGPSSAAKFGIILGVGIPLLLLVVWVALFILEKVRVRRELERQPVTELSTVTNGQAAPLVAGLDGPTIESYPKTQLGESWELPEPNSNTCSICLSEYRPKDTLRTIPDCKHYFHASCVDVWLGKNVTCPLCRKLLEKV